jgi:hypothetical protein
MDYALSTLEKELKSKKKQYNNIPNIEGETLRRVYEISVKSDIEDLERAIAMLEA